MVEWVVETRGEWKQIIVIYKITYHNLRLQSCNLDEDERLYFKIAELGTDNYITYEYVTASVFHDEMLNYLMM